jgi:hypothetical protein
MSILISVSQVTGIACNWLQVTPGTMHHRRAVAKCEACVEAELPI